MADDDGEIGLDDDRDIKDEPQTPPRRTGSAGSDHEPAPKSPVNSGSAAAPAGPQSPAAGSGGGGAGPKSPSAAAASASSGPARSAITGQPLNHDLITLKVAVVGPKQSGKTLIANHLSGFSDVKPGDQEKYEPTIGVRVLEFERAITARSRDGKNSMDTKVLVELWDCSGDSKFEGCWPAITKDVLGVAVVFDPKSKAHTAELKAWTEWFARSADLDSNQCVLWAHGTLSTQHPNFGPIKTAKKQLSIPVVNVNTLSAAPAGAMDAARKPSSSQLAFNHFLGDIFAYHKLADFA